jgi:methylenetetrahydrofolate reductase (NADPH)
MLLADRLHAGEFAVALEITPPQRSMPAVLLRRATCLGAHADAVNVIQRSDRQSSLDASIELLGAGLEPVWHLVTRGATRSSVAADLARAREAGIRQVLCVRGDHAGADTAETPPIREAVAMVRQAMPGALVGATLNQYVPDRAAVVRNLVPKLRAGAGYIQTQPVFDLGTLAPVIEAARQASPGVRVIAMAVPLLSQAAVEGIQRRLQCRLPDAVLRRLGSGVEAGWALFAETLAALAASPAVDGVAIMTTEMDPPPGTGARIVAALRAAGMRPAP